MQTGCINPYCVYITANPGRTTFYAGVTNDLRRRIFEHHENRGKKETFAGRYFSYELLYYECYPEMNMAINRENEIKDLSREKKLDLIKGQNPGMTKLLMD
jgi:putative endonuclease